MKQFIRNLMIVGVYLMIAVSHAFAGDDLETKIKQMAGANAKGYMAPLVSGFGMAMNSGIFHSASTHSVLGFDFQPVIAMAFAPSSEKSFTPQIPDNYQAAPGNTEKASTAIGKKHKNVYYLNGIQNDQTDLILPGGAGVPAGGSGFFVAPQLTVGVPFKTDVILRYVPKINTGKVGKVGLFGLGVKHNVNQWLPISIPVDLAVGGMYQKLAIGSIFKATSTSFNVIAGKDLNLLILKIGLYGGVGMESSSMDIKYTADAGVVDQNGNPVTQDVEFSLDGKNKARGFVGTNIRLLWLFNLNAEAAIGKYKSVNVGVGITLR